MIEKIKQYFETQTLLSFEAYLVHCWKRCNWKSWNWCRDESPFDVILLACEAGHIKLCKDQLFPSHICLWAYSRYTRQWISRYFFFTSFTVITTLWPRMYTYSRTYIHRTEIKILLNNNYVPCPLFTLFLFCSILFLLFLMLTMVH